MHANVYAMAVISSCESEEIGLPCSENWSDRRDRVQIDTSRNLLEVLMYQSLFGISLPINRTPVSESNSDVRLCPRQRPGPVRGRLETIYRSSHALRLDEGLAKTRQNELTFVRIIENLEIYSTRARPPAAGRFTSDGQSR